MQLLHICTPQLHPREQLRWLGTPFLSMVLGYHACVYKHSIKHKQSEEGAAALFGRKCRRIESLRLLREVLAVLHQLPKVVLVAQQLSEVVVQYCLCLLRLLQRLGELVDLRRSLVLLEQLLHFY